MAFTVLKNVHTMNVRECLSFLSFLHLPSVLGSETGPPWITDAQLVDSPYVWISVWKTGRMDENGWEWICQQMQGCRHLLLGGNKASLPSLPIFSNCIPIRRLSQAEQSGERWADSVPPRWISEASEQRFFPRPFAPPSQRFLWSAPTYCCYSFQTDEQSGYEPFSGTGCCNVVSSSTVRAAPFHK